MHSPQLGIALVIAVFSHLTPTLTSGVEVLTAFGGAVKPKSAFSGVWQGQWESLPEHG